MAMTKPDHKVPIVRFQASRHDGSEPEFYAGAARWEWVRSAWHQQHNRFERAEAHARAAAAYALLAGGEGSFQP